MSYLAQLLFDLLCNGKQHIRIIKIADVQLSLDIKVDHKEVIFVFQYTLETKQLRSLAAATMASKQLFRIVRRLTALNTSGNQACFILAAAGCSTVDIAWIVVPACQGLFRIHCPVSLINCPWQYHGLATLHADESTPLGDVEKYQLAYTVREV